MLSSDVKERVFELAKRANLATYASEGLGGGGYCDNQKEFEAFAKLIVQECFTVMERTSIDAAKNFTYMGDDVPTIAHISELRKHFGITR